MVAEWNKDVGGMARVEGIPVHAAHEVPRQGNTGEATVRSARPYNPESKSVDKG